MKSILFILLCLGGLNTSAQQFKCGWYGKKTVEQRNKIFPFSDAKKIVLVSYRNYELGNPLADTLTLEEAREIDPRIIRKYVLNGTVETDSRVYFVVEEKTLDEAWTNQLSHILCNYIPYRKPKGGFLISQAICYTPRNSILFLDENNNVFCYYEMCFQCGGSVIEPDPADLNKYADMEECHPRMEEVKLIFRKNRISYGIDLN